MCYLGTCRKERLPLSIRQFTPISLIISPIFGSKLRACDGLGVVGGGAVGGNSHSPETEKGAPAYGPGAPKTTVEND